MKQTRVTITRYKTVTAQGRRHKEKLEQKTMWAKIGGLSSDRNTSGLEVTQRESMEMELRTCKFTRQLYLNAKDHTLTYQGNEYAVTTADEGRKPDEWLRFKAYRVS